MRLILVRHGDPDYAKDALTEKGKREAALLTPRVAKWEVTDFYSSPLGRARETADIAMRQTGRRYEILPWAQEFFHLIDDGKGGKRIPWDFYPAEWATDEANFTKQEWTQTPRMQSGDIGRYYKEVCDGADALIAKYGLRREGNFYRAERHSGDTAVLFCHFGLRMIVLPHLLNLPAQALLHGLFTAPTSVTVLTSEERYGDEAYFRCQMIGDTRHLYEGGEEISSSGYFAPIFQG